MEPLKDLTPMQARILNLLEQGRTDGQISKELNISTRSICYAMRDMMDKCGGNSRFQVGVAWGLAQLK